MFISKKRYNERIKEAYELGLHTADEINGKCYKMGWLMGETERTNRGFIASSKLDQELEDILRGGE